MSNDFSPSSPLGYEPETQNQVLRDHLDYARSVIDTVHDALLVLDEQLLVHEANRSFYETFQVTEDDTVGKLVYDLGDGQWNNPELRTLLNQVFLTNQDVQKFLITHIFPKTGKRHMHLNARRFVGRNQTSRLLLAIRDVTDQYQAEKALELHVAELERSNAELEQFAFLASHDLQAPMQTIISYLRLLMDRYGGGQLGPDADDFIQFTLESATHLQHMTCDLLRYARINEQLPEFKSVDLQMVLDRALANLPGVIEESEAVITNDDLPKVRGDEHQLVQVFQNLIDNAIKFRNESPPEIYVSAQELDTAWQISVQDDGIGIDPDHCERIFDLFQQVYGFSKFAGSGIGLAIAKRIVELHGGTMWVESTLGQGATFYFTLAKEHENFDEPS